LLEHKATGLVASAACGADLLALEEAGKLGLPRRIVLPFPRDEFREGSVADRPGVWGPLYDQIVDEVQARGELVVLGATGDPDAAYGLATTAILDEAQQLAQQMGEGRNSVIAFAVWDLVPRGAGDLTVTFANQAKERGLAVVNIPTLVP
jgi:hypothetical protein